MEQVHQIFQVMTYDIDFAGVVSNITYIRWLEDLRNFYADQVLPIGAALNRGIFPVLGRTEIDYLSLVRFPDKVAGRMWLSERGNAKFVLSAEFNSQTTGMITAKSKQLGVFVSQATLRPIPLPDEFRNVELLPAD